MENSDFNPYPAYKPTLDMHILVPAQGWPPVPLNFRHNYPISGDANNRESAAELGANLRSIVAGPKLSGTAWVEVLPDLTRWQGDVLSAAAVALPQRARMTISPRRKQ